MNASVNKKINISKITKNENLYCRFVVTLLSKLSETETFGLLAEKLPGGKKQKNPVRS